MRTTNALLLCCPLLLLGEKSHSGSIVLWSATPGRLLTRAQGWVARYHSFLALSLPQARTQVDKAPFCWVVGVKDARSLLWVSCCLIFSPRHSSGPSSSWYPSSLLYSLLSPLPSPLLCPPSPCPLLPCPLSCCPMVGAAAPPPRPPLPLHLPVQSKAAVITAVHGGVDAWSPSFCRIPS